MNPMNPSIASDHIAVPLKEAVSCHEQGRFQEALENYQQVLDADPANFDALHGVGILYGQLGRFAEALKFIGQAGAVRPDNVAVPFNQGKAYQELKRFDEALASYDKTLSLKPDFAEAYNNRGNVLKELQRHEEALADYDRAIALKPNYVAAHLNRAAALLLLKRHGEALASCDRAQSLRPDLAQVYNNRGNILRDLRRHGEALAEYERALALNPNYVEAHNNRGHVLKDLHRYEAALASYDRAIALRPDYADAHYSKSHLQLLLGDFEQGWRLHEWRWKLGRQKDSLGSIKRPMWLGGQSPAGRTILLHSEQGLGDAIQFARYVPLVAALGARVVLGVPAGLAELFGTLEGDFTLVTQGATLPHFDLHCPLMSLPLAFKTRVDTIPAAVPYLAADPRRRDEWRRRLGAKVRPRVGLAWSGNGRHGNDRNRSLPLRSLAPLLDLDCEFHALQIEIRAEDRAALAEFTSLHTHLDELRDFADTAALIAELDVVITVDTSVAHLAGALGKALWIMLPDVPDFRWLTARGDSPWYPTACLFRQRSGGDWEGVIGEVRAALQAGGFADGEGPESLELTLPPPVGSQIGSSLRI